MKNPKQRRFALLVWGLIILLGSPGVRAAGLEADMVIYNGKILTVNSPEPNNFQIAQAAAIFDGKFIAVGTNEEALQYAGANTQKIDLGGRTVLPGLVETHDHIMGYSSHFFPEGKLQPGETDPSIYWTSKEDFLAQVRTLALKKKPGEWIITTPGGSGAPGIPVLELQRGEVTRFDLDKVAPNNPVDIHWNQSVEALLNTKALDMLLARYPKVPGVQRDAKGVPTGRIMGLAPMTMEYEFWPHVPPDYVGPYYKMEMEEVAAQGLTTVSTRLQPAELAGYAWLHSRGEMPIRMAYTSEAVARNANVDATFARLVGTQGGKGKTMWGAGDDKLWVVGMAATFSIDSVPSVAGSCVNKEYPREAPNFPLWRFQFYGPHGLCRLDDPAYTDADGVRAAAKYGFRVSAMHTGGDRGLHQFLDIVEEMSKDYPDIAERRWSIDHCRYLDDPLAERAKKYNIMFSCGPKYVYAGAKGDIGAFGILYGQKAGEDVVVPFRRIIDHGLRATMEIDEHAFHPFLALQVAVTRKDVNGKVWGPQQRISRREALYTYTRWSSEYVLRENSLGSIEPRKLADFVVLNRDYLTIPEDEIGRIDPVLTVVSGKVVYSQPEFAASVGLPVVGYQGDRSQWKRGTPDDANKRSGGGGGGG